MLSVQAKRRGRDFLSDEDVLGLRPTVGGSGAALSPKILVAMAPTEDPRTELVEELSIPDFARGDFDTLVARVEELLSLPTGWDSYGASPVMPEAALHALKVYSLLVRETLPRPQLVPTVQGGIQLEWHARGFDLEIEVLGRGRLEVFLDDEQAGRTIERSVVSLREYDGLDEVAELLTRRGETSA